MVSARDLDVRRVVLGLPPGHVNALRDLSTYTPTPPLPARRPSPACFSIPSHFLFLLNYHPRPSLRRLQRAFTDDALNPDLCPRPLPPPSHPPPASYSTTFRANSESDGVAAAIFFAETPKKRFSKCARSLRRGNRDFRIVKRNCKSVASTGPS